LARNPISRAACPHAGGGVYIIYHRARCENRNNETGRRRVSLNKSGGGGGNSLP